MQNGQKTQPTGIFGAFSMGWVERLALASMDPNLHMLMHRDFTSYSLGRSGVDAYYINAS